MKHLDRFPDWLILAQETWDDVERRNQLLFRELAARRPRSRFMFTETPLRTRQVRQWRVPRLRQVEDNIWAIQPIRPIPEIRGPGRADQIEAIQIQRAMRNLGIQRYAIWTQDPRAASLVDHLEPDLLFYDLTDDWAAFETEAVKRSRVEHQIGKLHRAADLVIACSRPLQQQAQALGADAMYLPNGVDPLSEGNPEPHDLVGLPRPRLGYVGTLHPARIDVQLIVDAAIARPDWAFVFVGPNQLESNDSARLFELTNVHHLGVRPHKEIRAYLESMDICLLPNLVTDFTRSLDPLKIYEYLAAGRPIISTPVGTTPDLAEFIDVATSSDELIAAAERLIGSDDETLRTARRAAVQDETWSSRASEIDSLFPAEHRHDVDVSAVIVSFNTMELLDRCLVDLHQSEGVRLQTVVVDNASVDGSAEMVALRHPETEIIRMGSNAGFGPANNAGLVACRGRYVLLLNSDCYLEPDTVSRLVAAAGRHPDAAVVGPRLLNEDLTLQRSAWPFPSARRMLVEAVGLHRILSRLGLLEDLRTWPHDEERSVDFLVGACLLVRREALLEVAGFDEDFWLYSEESDLQKRLRARGWDVVLVPDAQAVHVGGASSSDSDVRNMHFYGGQLRFIEKHGSRFAREIARFAVLLGAVLRRRWSVARVAWRLRRV